MMQSGIVSEEGSCRIVALVVDVAVSPHHRYNEYYRKIVVVAAAVALVG